MRHTQDTGGTEQDTPCPPFLSHSPVLCGYCPMSHHQYEAWMLLSRCASKVHQHPTPGCASAPPTAKQCSLHQGSNRARLCLQSWYLRHQLHRKQQGFHTEDPETGLKASQGFLFCPDSVNHRGKYWDHSSTLAWLLEMGSEARTTILGSEFKLDRDSMSR